MRTGFPWPLQDRLYRRKVLAAKGVRVVGSTDWLELGQFLVIEDGWSRTSTLRGDI